MNALARRDLRWRGVELSTRARETLERLPAELHRLPVCVAKTHLSLSHDPELVGAPSGFVLPVRELRAYTGAGWIVAVCGETQTMPGSLRTPLRRGWISTRTAGSSVSLI